MNQQSHQADTPVAAHAVPPHAELPVIVAAAQPVSPQTAADKVSVAAKPATPAKAPTAAAAIQMEQDAASKQAKQQAADKLLRKKWLGESEGEEGAESSVDTSYEVAAADTGNAAAPAGSAANAAAGSTAAGSGWLQWLPLAGGGLGGLAAIGTAAAAAAPSTFAVTITAVAGPVTAALNYKIYDAAGNVVAFGVTDATGKVIIDLDNAYAGQAMLLVISDANGSAVDFRDETTNGVGAGTSLGGTALRAAFVATGSSQSITVSPITELAVEKMGITTNAATASAATVTATNASIGTAMGVTDILGAVTTVLSADYNEANGIDAAEAYGQALAKLSGLDALNGSMSATFAQLLAALNITDATVRASTLGTLLNEGAARFEAGVNSSLATLVLAPTLAITDGVASGPTNAPVTYTFTFSEAVTGFGAADVTVTNGTKDTFTAVSTTVYTLVVTPTASAEGADIGVSVDSGAGGIGYQSTLSTSIVKTAAAQAFDTLAPVVTSTALNAPENGTAVASLTATDTNAVSWSTTLSGADAALFSLTAGGVLTFNGAKNYESDAHAYNLSVQATDTAGNVTTQAITVNLTDVNEAPTVANAIADQTFVVGGAVDNFAFAANAFADPDNGVPNNTLTYTATLAGGGALPAWLSFDAGTRTFSGNPPASGATTVRVTATDGGTGNLSVFDDFVIHAISEPTITSTLEGATVNNFDVRSNIVLTASENVDLTGITGGTKFIHIVNSGGTGYRGESATHTLDIDVTDSSQVTIVGNKITLNPTYDLDLSNNYYITIDAGAFHGVTSGLASLAVSSVTAMDFSTVTPGVAVNSLTPAVLSQKMDAAGALANSYQYLDVEGIGNNTGSMTLLTGSLGSGQYALVLKNYEDVQGGAGAGYDGVLAHDSNIGVNDFGGDDLIYIDSQFNTATSAYDMAYTTVADGQSTSGVTGPGQNLVYFGTQTGQDGSAANIVMMSIEGNTANNIFADLPGMKTTLGWTADPVIQG